MTLATGLLLAASCSQEVLTENNEVRDGFLKATASSFESLTQEEGTTRSVLEPTGETTVAFKWASGDQLAIYSSKGSGMTNFDLVDGINSNVAQFKANGFSLAPGAKYYAFTPYDGVQTNKNEIELDYSGQLQTSDNSFDNIGAKDFQYSEETTAASANANELTDFKLKHLGTVCRLRLTVPETAAYTEFSLKGEKLVSKGKFDITTSTFTPEQTGAISMSLGKGINKDANSIITLYLMLPSQDLSGSSLTVELCAGEKTFGSTIDGVNLKSGNVHNWSASVSELHTFNGHDFVDLGLPSGTLWATCNIGAENPADGGLYFAWGETVGYGPGTSNGENGVTTDGHKFYLDDLTTYKKYTFEDDYKQGCWYENFRDYVGTTVNGITYKNLTKLLPEDDAATANWGEGWFTPTKAQWDELIANCYFRYSPSSKGFDVYKRFPDDTQTDCFETSFAGSTRYNDYNTSITHLFIPFPGQRYATSSYRDDSLDEKGTSGYYWSSELGNKSYSGSAMRIYYNANDSGKKEKKEKGSYMRYRGFPVRPVCMRKK